MFYTPEGQAEVESSLGMRQKGCSLGNPRVATMKQLPWMSLAKYFEDRPSLHVWICMDAAFKQPLETCLPNALPLLFQRSVKVGQIVVSAFHFKQDVLRDETQGGRAYRGGSFFLDGWCVHMRVWVCERVCACTRQCVLSSFPTMEVTQGGADTLVGEASSVSRAKLPPIKCPKKNY